MIFDNLLILPVYFVYILFSCIFLPFILSYPLNAHFPFKRAKSRRRLNCAPDLRGRRFTAGAVGPLFQKGGTAQVNQMRARFSWPVPANKSVTWIDFWLSRIAESVLCLGNALIVIGLNSTLGIYKWNCFPILAKQKNSL